MSDSMFGRVWASLHLSLLGVIHTRAHRLDSPPKEIEKVASAVVGSLLRGKCKAPARTRGRNVSKMCYNTQTREKSPARVGTRV